MQDSVGLNSGSLFDNATGSRKIYLIEIPNLDIEEKQEITEDDTQLLITIDQSVNDTIKDKSGGLGDIEEYKSCMICMEDLPADQLRQHNACDCIICNPCLER